MELTLMVKVYTATGGSPIMELTLMVKAYTATGGCT